MAEFYNIFYYQGNNCQSGGVTVAACFMFSSYKTVQWWLREAKMQYKFLYFVFEFPSLLKSR